MGRQIQVRGFDLTAPVEFAQRCFIRHSAVSIFPGRDGGLPGASVRWDQGQDLLQQLRCWRAVGTRMMADLEKMNGFENAVLVHHSPALELGIARKEQFPPAPFQVKDHAGVVRRAINRE